MITCSIKVKLSVDKLSFKFICSQSVKFSSKNSLLVVEMSTFFASTEKKDEYDSVIYDVVPHKFKMRFKIKRLSIYYRSILELMRFVTLPIRHCL